MMKDTAIAIANADRHGAIEHARSATSEVTHLRIAGSRYAICGVRTTRRGAGARDCRNCATKLAHAKQAT